MTTIKLLSQLRDRDVRLWVDGDRLRYSAPDGALTSELRAELAEHKMEIIEFLREAETAVHTDSPPLLRVSRDGELPLSFAQQRLWFIDQLVPGNPFYNIPMAVRLRGSLNAAVLEQTLREIVRRHEVMRTTFSSENGRPVQKISPDTSLTLPLVDLSGMSGGEQEARVRKIATEEAKRPFDLTQDPLLRATLLRLGEEDHVLLCIMHHIVSDAWSIGVLMQEFATLYQAFVEAKPSPLPELPVQYADFAYWQRQWLQGAVLEKHLSYWKKRLEGSPPVLELPTDRPRPPVQTFHGAVQFITLPHDLYKSLKELSRREEATLFMTLLAAFQALLYRYSGQDDIIVGCPIANRNLPETERMIGFFVNTLVLRTDLSGDPSFKELLRQVREVALGAYAHQDLPFEYLVDALKLERNLSYTPLCQVAFQLQNARRGALELPGLTVSPLEVGSETAKFDLTLSMIEGTDTLAAYLEYNTDLFNHGTITRMLGHFQTLLEGIVAHPEQRLSSLPLITESERQQLLVEWNDTTADFPRDRCIHELFQAQVEKRPEAIALVYEDEQLTYAELNRRANQVAQYLQASGVGPEVLVGICVERSIEMIIGLLGVLKAGGAYVPLDPSYPPERLAFMLEDTQMPVLLTQQSLLERLPHHSAQVVCLDTGWEKMSKEPEENPLSNVTPENLAYVIYTSGSTGRPKGTLLQHRGLCNFAQAYVHDLDVTADSCFLQFFSFSFDGSVAEIFTSLLAGAKLCLVSRDTILSGQDLLQMLRQQQVTTAILPPSLLAVLPVEGLPAFQTLISAGEACTPDIVARWASDRRLYNGYGPTEATVGPALYPVENTSDRTTNVPIGRPIANIQIYLLDRHLRPVPIGVPGELCIGGVGLARGYLNRPELTAQKFIPNPFSQEAGARLYKTGDLARYLPNGNIEFLGRIDHQVKIRGYRVELEEIESVLNSHSLVEDAVVTANQDKNLIIAYYTAKDKDISEDNKLELWPSVAEFFVYDDLLYYAMTHDEQRNESYKVAINRQVKNKVVVDIGTGKDAILARFCVEAGAKRVYAIELLEESYQQAKECLQRLALEDKIVLIHGDSTQVKLPEKVDVCVSEIVGPIGGCEGAAKILNDARRFLKENGVMIPIRSTTRIAAVTLPDDFLNYPGFTDVTRHYVEQIFEQVGYKFDLRLCLKGLDKLCLISNSDVFEDLDFSNYVPLESSRELNLTITRDSRIDGFLVWLNLYTVADEVIDILEHEHCWLPVYFPVFYPGIEVSEGDTIKATVRSQLCENNLNPDYTVKGSLLKKNGEVIDFEYNSFHFKQSFRKSSFYNLLFSHDSIKVRKKNEEKASPTELRAYLKKHLPEYLVPAAYVRLEALPLTPNGKVDRRALPAPEPDRPELETSFIAPRSPQEEVLAGIWSQVLGLEQVGVYDNFFELGGDSMRIIQVVARANKAGLGLTPAQLFQYPTIASLAEVVGTTEFVQAEQGIVTGPVPLTPIQQWFFEKQFPDPHHWNWAFLREVPQDLDTSLLEQTIKHLLIHHDALRLRFQPTESGWRQVSADVDENVPFTTIDLSMVAPEEQIEVLESAVAALQGSLNLSQGPLFRIVYFVLGTGKVEQGKTPRSATNRVLIIFHHLVVDVISTRVLMEDFQTAFQQLRGGQTVKLPPKTTSFQSWARRLTEYAQSPELRQELDYWVGLLKDEVPALPLDYPDGVNSEASTDIVLTALSGDETQALLQQIPAAHGAQINELLLTALVRSFSTWTGKRTLLIEMEGHGREYILDDVDLSRTVGWFTSIYPVRLDLGDAAEPAEALEAIRTQLRRIPNRGIGYGLLRYLCEDLEIKKQMSMLPRAQVNFNYLGQLDQKLSESTPFRMARESKGPERSLRGLRAFPLYIVASVRGGVLRWHWNYSTNLHKRATIERLANRYIEELQILIASCLSGHPVVQHSPGVTADGAQKFAYE